jgi:hypothetical protein
MGFGIAAIERVTGKAGLCAKILPAGAAEGAFATGPTQPRNADARAGHKPFRALTALDHFTDDFVSRHKREFRVGEFAIENVQVGPAHRAGTHSDEDLTPLRLRHRQIGFTKRPPRFTEHHRAHEQIRLRAAPLVKPCGGSVKRPEGRELSINRKVLPASWRHRLSCHNRPELVAVEQFQRRGQAPRSPVWSRSMQQNFGAPQNENKRMGTVSSRHRRFG